MSGVFTFGETMALVRADTGPWETTSTAAVSIGGADSNVAIGLVRLGVPACWAGRVGDDALGRRVVRELRAEGIDVRATTGPGRTGLMLKEKRTPFSSTVVFYRTGSAGSTLAPQDIPLDVVATADLVHVTGITPALSASARETVDTVIDAARAAGVPVSFDVNHRPTLWGDTDPAPVYRSIARRSDIVFAGEEEAALLLGGDSLVDHDVADDTPATLARELADLGPREVIVKLGVRGSVAVIGEDVLAVPAVSVPVVDTVGAGDAFVAGYLAARLSGASAQERLTRAAEAGAFACLSAGDWEGLPRPVDLALLDAKDPVTR